MIFNEQLICRRKQKGLSQEQLGDLIGVTRQTVSKWELGETTPEMDKLIQLSKLFEVSIDELVGNETPQTNNGTYCMAYNSGRYEYKSKKTLWGLPLVHVNLGVGLCKAKGIIAIGNVACGLISIGLVNIGLISIGMISFGLITLASIGVGLLLSAGGISVGTVAFGGISVGILSAGGLAIGQYALGGCAIASKIAKGGYADAIIAIGDEVKGEITFDINVKGQAELIRQAIRTRFPDTWKLIVNLFAGK
jgi:DNA-binding XRE family transcriptional regulator